MQKVLVFGQMSEFLSTVIKSCRANFGVKWRVFFSTSIFVQKCQFWGKKLNFVRNDFFKQVCTTNESEHLIGKHAYFQKIVTFCVIVYIHQETRILIKTLIFLRKCLFVHVLIFIRVFLLLENCYFDSKYDFIRWYFGKSVIFLVKFTFQVFWHIEIFWKRKFREIFWEKVLIFSFSCQLSGKMTIGIRRNLIVSFLKKWQFVLFQLFRYVCFTGISENLAETPILKDIFIFLANGHCFQKL